MINVINLAISKQVESGQIEIASYIPPSGSDACVLSFVGSAAFSPNAAAYVKFGNTIIWSTKGASSMPPTHQFEIQPASTDGAKAVEVCLDNGDDGPLIMSAYAQIMVKT